MEWKERKTKTQQLKNNTPIYKFTNITWTGITQWAHHGQTMSKYISLRRFSVVWPWGACRELHIVNKYSFLHLFVKIRRSLKFVQHEFCRVLLVSLQSIYIVEISDTLTSIEVSPPNMISCFLISCHFWSRRFRSWRNSLYWWWWLCSNLNV